MAAHTVAIGLMVPWIVSDVYPNTHAVFHDLPHKLSSVERNITYEESKMKFNRAVTKLLRNGNTYNKLKGNGFYIRLKNY